MQGIETNYLTSKFHSKDCAACTFSLPSCFFPSHLYYYNKNKASSDLTMFCFMLSPQPLILHLSPSIHSGTLAEVYALHTLLEKRMHKILRCKQWSMQHLKASCAFAGARALQVPSRRNVRVNANTTEADHLLLHTCDCFRYLRSNHRMRLLLRV